MLPRMAEWWSNPEADDSFLQFRERSVRDGVWLSLVTIVIVLVYVLVSWDSGHRVLIIVLLAGAWRAPTPCPSCRPRRSCARAGASTSSSSGRPPTSRSSPPSSARTAAARSVLGAIFFLPLIFGSLSYPARSVAICGAMSVFAYAAAALLAGGAEADAVAVFSALLVAAAVMGVSQAVQPRAPAARACAALALGPADGLPQPPRLHRALRGGAVGPRAPRRAPARA